MTDGLLKLMAWLSPSFPVGAYTYSHGLETAIEQGWVHDRQSLEDWLADLMDHGAPRNDALFIKLLFDGHDIAELNELALAFQPSRELKLETLQQGKAFMRALRKAWPDDTFRGMDDLAYPLALGLAAKVHRIAATDTISAYLHSSIANLISAAVRAIPLGQSDGLLVLQSFEARIPETTMQILQSGMDDLGSSVLMSDIASMLHETQHTRLFRS